MPLARSLPLMPLRNPPSGRGERTRSLAAEFNAATSAPKSEQPSIIVVAVLARERVESILTTHLLKNNLVRPLSSRLFKRGFNRAVPRVVCSEFRRRRRRGRFLENLSGGDFLHSSFFRGKESRQTDGRRDGQGDMRAATLGRAPKR